MPHRKNLMLVLAFIGMALGELRTANSATITVNSFAQSPGGVGDCTLGEAIQAANTDTAVDGCTAGSGSDIINLPFGSYVLLVADNTTQGDNGLPDITSNITINGTGLGSGATLITRAVAAPLFRIFHIAPSGILLLSNLTLDNGEATVPFIGGALHNNQGLVNIADCSILNSSAASGGGISNFMGTVSIADSFLAGNKALTDTGGGVYNAGGIVNITNSTIYENGASAVNGDGGGFHNAAGGIMTIVSSTIERNSAGDSGGGLNNEDGTVNITRATFSDNHALNGAGGAIASGSEFVQAVVNISNSTFSGNSARTLAGGIGSLGILNATNITISGNTSGNLGGGIAIDGTITLKNSIIAGNAASGMGPDCAGTITISDHNLIGNNANCTISSGAGNLLNVNPQVGLLQDNGGPTETHALLPGSPAIDAGTNIGVAGTDQRGFPRISNGIVDIGAYEYQVRNPVPTLTEWGTIMLAVVLGVASVYCLRRRGLIT